ncbi:hypothetical protein [Deinococcus humi]|uniref:Uncharacterized protein n=1 Tax=Deinococcus humi TaxID=662880 RepID=A0A7W8NH83_9DEIO|nr:hypothetical protein [Deinococcus humi]MBB5364543.1 hypothetical protein [Deinococcus humi]GGO38094.1 hypothetical protein GCM10008949_44220 [Deinococcus humi]
MRHLMLTAALMLPTATAQISVASIPALPPGVVAQTTPAAPAAAIPVQAGPVARVEIQDVEITSPVSAGATPTVASDDVGEVMIPVLATDKDGNPVAGVAVTWEVKNTGKAPVYVISSMVDGTATAIAATIAPDETVKYETMTGMDGTVTLLLNATASTAAALKLTASTGEVKNLRDAAQTIDWIGQ